jgi:hypothetical protein
MANNNPRPRGGHASASLRTVPFQMRVSEQFLRWSTTGVSTQVDLPSRAEAIRRMVELTAKRNEKAGADR